MNRVWTIARREVKALFDQPTGYVLLVVFLAINAFMFFRNAYLTGGASLRPMLDLLPWMLLFFVPAVAMRSLAEDTRSGLLEIVLAQPLSEAELVLGKYLGVLLVLVGGLATTLLIPVGLDLGSPLPWGPVVAQYTGAALFAAGFAGIGVWASSITRSQITAFILGVAVMFVLILVGLNPLLVGLPPALGSIAARLGVLTHFESIGRGVLDLRDVLYFVSLAAMFLALAWAAIVRRRLAPGGPPARRLRLVTGLLVAVLVALNLVGGEVRGRLDLTPGNAYTLSPASRDLARSLDDMVHIDVYASNSLPAEFASVKRDVDDLLRDLRAAGRGKIRVVETDPGAGEEAAQAARTAGVTPVQFNVVGQSELSVKEGYLGLIVRYADQREAIPFVQRADDLEYRLVSIIRNLTRTGKPTVVVAADPQAGGFSVLQGELGKSYTVRAASLTDSAALAGAVDVLILAGARDSVPADEQDRVRAYLERGGRAMVMESGMMLSPREPFASSRIVRWNPVLKPYGVQIRSDMVYDLRAHQIIGVPSQFGRVLRPYPYFLRAQSTHLTPLNAELGELGLAWTSSLDTAGAAPGTVTPLFVTSEAGGADTDMAMIDPSRDNFRTDSLRTRILAVQVAPAQGGEGKRGARLVVIGSTNFASDDFVQRSPENLTFALNAVDWLAQDESLIAIRAKDRRPPVLAFASGAVRDTVKYLNMIGLPVLIALWGVIRLARRRRRATTPYRPLARPEVA
jgi:ABC-type uncharacterized transport system involved in gliding motility auxiliary subunit/ABC-type transport system involved in multi-copper enzyme maturation permease subunit